MSYIICFVIAISLIVMVIFRISLKKKAKELSNRISQSRASMGLPKDIECSFADKVISSSDETYFESQYSKIYKEACALSKNQEPF